MAAVLIAVGTFVYARMGTALLNEVDAGLSSRAEVLAAEIGSGGPDIPDVSATLIESDEAFAQIVDRSGHVLHSSPIVATTPLLGPTTIRTLTRPGFFDRPIPGIDNVTRVLAVPVESSGRRYVLLVGASLQDRRDELLQLAATLGIGGPVALVIISLAGWLLVGAALRPVEQMRSEAAAISALEPGRRLPVPPGGDELARLASTLNAMLGRLQESFDRERHFVDDASHELRTPLGILRGRLELALSRRRSPQELEEVLRQALGETERLSRLAEDLLVLARTEGGRVPIHREDVHLAELLAEAVTSYRMQAEAIGVRLEVEAANEPARLDPVRTRQIVQNLLDNSMRHVQAGGYVRVAAARGNGEVRIRIDDSGDGFPSAFLEDALEPFTRGPEDARHAGAGLGLAIVRAIAEAHGGSVSAENRPGGGARVTVTLGG